MCVGTKVCGTKVCGRNRVWAQMCVGTIVWAQSCSYGHKCGGTAQFIVCAQHDKSESQTNARTNRSERCVFQNLKCFNSYSFNLSLEFRICIFYLYFGSYL